MTDRLRPYPDHSTLEEFASRAHADLSNLPEFGEATAVAIVDTASMFLWDAGWEVDDLVDEDLREIAKSLAGGSR